MKQPPIYYADFVHTPMPVHVGLFRWRWLISDGMVGRILASGTTCTRAGALRQRIRAEVRCEQRAPYTHAPLHPLTRQEIGWINAVLDMAGIPAEVSTCGNAVVMTRQRELTTEQEVQTLHAVCGRTDAPVRWAGVA